MHHAIFGQHHNVIEMTKRTEAISVRFLFAILFKKQPFVGLNRFQAWKIIQSLLHLTKWKQMVMSVQVLSMMLGVVVCCGACHYPAGTLSAAAVKESATIQIQAPHNATYARQLAQGGAL